MMRVLTVTAISFCMVMMLKIAVQAPKPIEYAPEHPVIVETIVVSPIEEMHIAPTADEPPVLVDPFRITVYTPFCDDSAWGHQTATGVTSEHLKTCAVDPKVIPLGSLIEVNGLRLRAVDVGGAVRGKKIDVFVDMSIDEALEWLGTFGEYHDVVLLE